MRQRVDGQWQAARRREMEHKARRDANVYGNPYASSDEESTQWGRPPIGLRWVASRTPCGYDIHKLIVRWWLQMWILAGQHSMGHDPMGSRLSRIATQWTLLEQAHASDQDQVRRAQATLIERYQRALYKYLVAALRDPDAADEVFQEFAVRLLRGDFRAADPQRGSFRSYLKTVIARMVIDFHRRRQRAARVGAAEVQPAELGDISQYDSLFDENWRSELLDRTWAALGAQQADSGRSYYDVLKYRAEHPKATSDQIAEALSMHQPDHTFTAAAVRQTLHRARQRFAELLIAEVARSVQSDDIDVIERELSSLALLEYCRSVVEARRRRQA